MFDSGVSVIGDLLHRLTTSAPAPTWASSHEGINWGNEALSTKMPESPGEITKFGTSIWAGNL